MEIVESVKTHQVEETSSYTRPDDLAREQSFSHRWTIEDFSVMLGDTTSEYPIFKSVSFSSPVNSAIKFILDLRPKGSIKDFEDYLSIFLQLTSSQENDIFVKYSFCLVNSKGEKCHESEQGADIYSPKCPSWGYNKFVLRSDLLDPANDLLNEDRLTILCEVTLLEQPFTVDTGKYRPSTQEAKVLSKRQTLMNLISLLECDKQTDVTVVVGNGANSKEIRAHKFVLVGGSSVFEAMFKYDTSEKQSGIVTLTDVSAEVGELFIRYLYTGKVNQLEAYAEELFVFADMYGIDLLKRMCVQSLCSQMSTSSVCQLLLLSDRHSSIELQHVCIEYITNHANEVIRTDYEDWQMMSQLDDQLKVDLLRKLTNKPCIDPIVIKSDSDTESDSDSSDFHLSSATQISKMEAIESVNMQQLKEISSYTRPSIYTFSHRWTIEDFSVMLYDTSSDYEYPEYNSAMFSFPANPEIQFVIQLYTGDDEDESKDYLEVYLKLLSPLENSIFVKYSFCLVNSKGEKCHESAEGPDIFSPDDPSWGDDKFVLRSDLLDPANELLNEDRLTILCEVTVFNTFTMNFVKYLPSLEEVKMFSKKKALVDLNSLFEQEKQTDVTVMVGGADEAKEIRAHKFVLVGASPVFEEMFENDATEDVPLSDVSVEVGELFIRYLYTGEVNQLETYAEELFVVADKYDIDLLKRMCVNGLYSQVNAESVFKLLLFADRHSSTELQLACIEYITNHTKEVILTEDWQMISQLDDQLKVHLFRKLANKH